MRDIARSISGVLAMCAASGVWFTCAAFQWKRMGPQMSCVERITHSPQFAAKQLGFRGRPQ